MIARRAPVALRMRCTTATIDGVRVTVVTGHAPFDVAPASSWATHGEFLTPAESEHGTVERAVQVLIESRQRR